MIHSQDIKMMLDLSILVKSLTINQCRVIGNFLNQFITRVHHMEDQWKRRQSAGCSSEYAINSRANQTSTCYNSNNEIPIKIPPLPQNPAEVRSKILNGKTSFLELLPHPKINVLDDGHVYILPSECIKDYLAHGNLPMNFNHSSVTYPIINLNQTT